MLILVILQSADGRSHPQRIIPPNFTFLAHDGFLFTVKRVVLTALLTAFLQSTNKTAFLPIF